MRKDFSPTIPYQNCQAGVGLCKVGDEDSQADGNQDRAPDDLHFLPEGGPQGFSQEPPGEREQETYQGDDQAGGEDIALHKGKTDAHCERIQAGGQGEHDQVFAAGRVGENHFLGFPKPAANHADTDPQQQPEDDPVVKIGDVAGDETACHPTDKGHQSLEDAKMECQPENGTPADTHLGANSQVDGQCIHGEAYCNKKYC